MNTTTTRSATPDAVQISDYANEYSRPGEKLVEPLWHGVDRPNTGGWVVKDARMATRLAAALMAGVVYDSVRVGTDVEGATYVIGSPKVMGKYMNADLKRLGF